MISRLYLEKLMDNNENTLSDYQLHENIIRHCLSDVTERVADLVHVTDVIMVDATVDPYETSKT